MERKAITGILVTLILFTGLIGLFNIPAVGCSAEWITATSSTVEMSIENKTTPLGEELSIFMVAPIGTFWLPNTQVFDVYLYCSNYSLFSYWSQDKAFWDVMTSVPPGYNETLGWNLYHYNLSTVEHTPPPPGDYYLVGAIMGWEDVTPPILIEIDNSIITPIGQSSFPGDCNGDRIVDILDIDYISAYWGGYDASADANNNGVVDIFDIGICSAHWGETW